MESKELRKHTNFSEWYDHIIEAADIIDKRYPVKGMLVWKPYGYKALKLAMRILENLLEEYGHEEAYFPMLVPEEVFAKEKDFLEGFSGETFVVERTISKVLMRKFLLRPTSETVMYYMFSLWIQSYKDLPVKLFQTVNVFRYETEHTRPILRVREIIMFNEAHTAHESLEDADRQIKEAIEIYRRFFDSLGLSYIILKTPKWDTFAGAEYNFDFFEIMPDKRAIELGSVINLGQKFAKAFDIKYQKPDGSYEYVYQTCYGVSERVIGVLISMHGDDRGIIFPSNIAPIQVIIIPIPYKGSEEAVYNKCEEIYRLLKKEGIRVRIDKTEKTPGEKYYYWELKGVPVRLEVGPRDIRNKTVTLVRRDTLKRVVISENELIDKIRKLFKEIDETLSERSWNWLRGNIHLAKSTEEARSIYKEKQGIIKLPWCGKDECGQKIEEITELDGLGHDPGEKAEGYCVICGKEARWYFYIGKKY